MRNRIADLPDGRHDRQQRQQNSDDESDLIVCHC
jgi:hypothetical protein